MLEHGVSDLLVHNVSHIGGPRFGYSRSQPPNTLQYGTIIATRGVTASRGTPMLMEHQPHEDSGWVLISSSHSEYAKNNSQTIFAAAWVDYAITLGSRTPALKGELEFGQSVQMVGATEKVGDGQYHRFVVDIPPGLPTVTFHLTDLRINADLYVQHEGYAHVNSYFASSTLSGRNADTITIENPHAGRWEISVHGKHSIANGAPYRLYVGQETPEAEVFVSPGQLAADLAFAELGRNAKQVGLELDDWPVRLSGSLVGRNPPWCSEFVSWAYAAAGTPFTGGSHGGWMLDNWSRVIRHFSNAGQYVKKGSDRWSEITPKPGDYVHMKGHSALVLEVRGDTLVTIEGNVKGRVVSREFPNWRNSAILGIGLLET
jgi:hypothetical protein